MWNLTYDDLRKQPAKGILVPPKGPERYRKYETGGMRLDGKTGFDTPTGKIEAFSTVLERHGQPALPEYREPMQTSSDYPLILISGSRLPYITHSKWREDAPWLMELQREPLLTINPKDADARGIQQGEIVRLKTPFGEMKVKAKPTIMVPAGIVGVMHGWAGANVNELIPRQFDPISGFPPYKEVVCSVLKA
jgi:anaerobic selenocysteine-containing dehydrogenase